MLAHHLLYTTPVRIVDGFMQKNEDPWLATKKSYKIHQTYLSTVTEITLLPTEVPSSPGWEMKDNGHTSSFKEIYIFL